LKTGILIRKFFIILAVVLGLLAIIGGGFKAYQSFQMESLAQKFKEAKEQRQEQKKTLTATEPDHPVSPMDPESQPAEDKPQRKETQLSKAAQPQKNREPSACSSVYQKYLENRKFTEAAQAALEDLILLATEDLEKDPCAQELTDLIDPDHFVELIKKCDIEGDKDLSDESKRACLTLMTLGWSVFAEAEYRDVDPSEIPPHALHSKIIFRLVERDLFLKNAGPSEKEYLFRLMDQMYKLRPDIDYGSMRSELLAEFHSRDPQSWRDDYRRVLEELESEDIAQAVFTFYEGHGRKMDKAFFDYVDDLVNLHPESPAMHIFKGFAHTGLGEWDNAAKELAEAERLGPEKNINLLKDLRESIQKKQAIMPTYSRTSVSIEMPGA
jgi:hypothetical protein